MEKNVSIILTASPSIVFRVIAWATKSDVSHSMIGYDDAFWGGKWTAAADWDGVRLYRAEQTCEYIAYEYRCKFDTSSGVAAVKHLINQPYDYIDIAAIGYVMAMWRFFKKKVRFPWSNPKAQICSEFVARFLMSCGGIPVIEQQNPEAVTPADIKKYCESHPELFEKVFHI